ncbi:MAG: host-nuclease inhibitor Gam family protein [Ignavibacteriales bacterium]|nr:host-nuclease inhibitor Gam family protein [Ignavibacteriales bacterium]
MADNFLDELLEMAEQKELAQTDAYYDLLLSEIKKMKDKIELNFHESEKEIDIINKFVLKKNSILDERIKFLEKKLESFIRERDVKSISLANGTLKMHKKQDKIEITDMDLFLKLAKKELLDVIPEQLKPSLTKIKQWIKSKPVPKGVTIIEGQPEFSYTLSNEEEDGREKETGIAA